MSNNFMLLPNGEVKILNQNAVLHSTGSDDYGKLVVLNEDGVFDASVLPIYFPPAQRIYIDEQWNGSDVRGSIGWLTGVANTATAGIIASVTDPTHAGVVGLATQSNAAGWASIYCADGNGNGCGVFCANTQTIMRWVVKITDLAMIGTNEFFVKCGMASNVSSTTEGSLNGIVFSYKATTSLNWEIIATKAGVETKITTSVPVDTDWVILEMQYNGTTAEFFINSNNVGTIAATNLPTSSTPLGLHARINKTLGINNRNLYVDRCSFLST